MTPKDRFYVRYLYQNNPDGAGHEEILQAADM